MLLSCRRNKTAVTLKYCNYELKTKMMLRKLSPITDIKIYKIAIKNTIHS
jgi:hypothetical protein